MSAACLLLHGFTGSPFELAHLVAPLEALGCEVALPTLPGHATSIADFRTTFFPDWFRHAEQSYLALKQTHDKVFIIGFSMGGSIALLLASRHAPAGIITLAAPLYAYRLFPLTLQSIRLTLTPILKYIQPEVRVRKAKPESRAIAPFKGYEGTLCLPQLDSLVTGLATARESLSSITCPTLIMHDMRDKISWPGSALNIAQSIQSQDVTLHYTRMAENITSHHMLPTHQETRDLISLRITEFVTRIAG